MYQAVNRPSNTDSTGLLYNNYSMPQNVYDLEDFKALKSDYSSMKNQHNDGIITK